jgi:hypothetical protein
MRVQEQRGELQREVSACRIARDDDVGRERAFIQQVLDGSSRLAELCRKGIFGCEGYCQTINASSLTSYMAKQRTVVEKGDPDRTLTLLL